VKEFEGEIMVKHEKHKPLSELIFYFLLKEIGQKKSIKEFT